MVDGVADSCDCDGKSGDSGVSGIISFIFSVFFGSFFGMDSNVWLDLLEFVKSEILLLLQ